MQPSGFEKHASVCDAFQAAVFDGEEDEAEQEWNLAHKAKKTTKRKASGPAGDKPAKKAKPAGNHDYRALHAADQVYLVKLSHFFLHLTVLFFVSK